MTYRTTGEGTELLWATGHVIYSYSPGHNGFFHNNLSHLAEIHVLYLRVYKLLHKGIQLLYIRGSQGCIIAISFILELLFLL